MRVSLSVPLSFLLLVGCSNSSSSGGANTVAGANAGGATSMGAAGGSARGGMSNAGGSAAAHGGASSSASGSGGATHEGGGDAGAADSMAGAEEGPDGGAAGASSTEGGAAGTSTGGADTGGSTAGGSGPLMCSGDAVVFSPPPDPPCAPSGCVPKQPGYLPFEVNTYNLVVPTSIGVADFNLDHHPDIVVTGSSAFVGVGLGMFVNKGDGTFGPATFIDTPYQFSPFTLATGDLNHDGYPDIAVSDTGGVRVFFNNQDLTFPVHPLNATSTTVNSIAIGKLDADSAPDLAIAESNAVAVMLNQGDGTFPTEVVYPIGGTTVMAYSVALGDVDNDGDLDVAFAAQYEVGILLNDGTGKLGTPKTYTAGHLPSDSPHAVAFAKLNGDAFVDLVSTNYGSQAGSIGVFMNQGDGTFAAQVSYATTANSNSTAGYRGDYRPAVGDLDGDGDIDLCVANFGADTIGVFHNAGDGTFGTQVPYAAGYFPDSAIAADFNGDGSLDLGVPTNQSNGQSAAGVFFARCQ